MMDDYSVDVCRALEEEFRRASLHRPLRVERYEPGTELTYDVTMVARGAKGRVRLIVERFIGGGFAGQVYRVRVTDVASEIASRGELEAGGVYALKILTPPTAFSRLFRNLVYWIGFQGPFQLQVNPTAAKAGALWQKLLRRGARIVFGDERAVVDIHATLVDPTLGSCGELSEWVDGRTWRLEVDERLDLLSRWKRGKRVDERNLGSPEYRAKREFMGRFVGLLHKMGAYELARQYEWSTWKSQPNCLKRLEHDDSPSRGLVAVDFRAGLALLPFLPMSPGDFKLIFRGLARGSLVQFDRGDLSKLERFIEVHRDEFADLLPLVHRLRAAERVYRESVPDITHNRLRLFHSPRLWSTILERAVRGWKIRDLVDERHEGELLSSRAQTLVFGAIGVVPLLGPFLRKIWGRPDWRAHYRLMTTSWNYLCRAVRARAAEKAIGWHRSGRIDAERALELPRRIWRLLYHAPLSVLPAGLHRSITDWRYAGERLDYLVLRPIRLYFNSELREEWLRDMVAEGREKQILSEEDWTTIVSQIKEPFIQKYLKSLAVHLCTLPVTQIVSVTVALVYVALHPEMPRAQAWGIGLGIIALFQVIPVSPGSLVRGAYVAYLVLRERNLRDYNIALILGFFKYVGYLAFPIQMAYRYPALARFMARHWATEAVHIVPVFGESGALLEHWVFCLFYNRPLTIRRRMAKRAEARAALRPRYWPIAACALAGAAVFALADFIHAKSSAAPPDLIDVWYLAAVVPTLCGAVVSLGAGGARLSRRIVGAGVGGVLVAVLSSLASLAFDAAGSPAIGEAATGFVWRVFVFSILSTIGLLATELVLPEPSE